MINISYHLLKYVMITIIWDIIKHSNKFLIILFAYFVAANLYYNLFAKLLKDFSLFSIYNKLKNLAIGTNYGQYNKFIASLYLIYDFNLYETNTIDVYGKNNKKIKDNNNIK